MTSMIFQTSEELVTISCHLIKGKNSVTEDILH